MSAPAADGTVVEGFRLPDDRSLTQNERAWLELLRAIAGDSDPAPSLAAVQALRQVPAGR